MEPLKWNPDLLKQDKTESRKIKVQKTEYGEK